MKAKISALLDAQKSVEQDGHRKESEAFTKLLRSV